jgi:hypothetical protein
VPSAQLALAIADARCHESEGENIKRLVTVNDYSEKDIEKIGSFCLSPHLGFGGAQVDHNKRHDGNDHNRRAPKGDNQSGNWKNREI